MVSFSDVYFYEGRGPQKDPSNDQLSFLLLPQGDDPKNVAEKIGTKNSLEPLMKEALRLRIQEEIEKRISKR